MIINKDAHFIHFEHVHESRWKTSSPPLTTNDFWIYDFQICIIQYMLKWHMAKGGLIAQ